MILGIGIPLLDIILPVDEEFLLQNNLRLDNAILADYEPEPEREEEKGYSPSGDLNSGTSIIEDQFKTDVAIDVNPSSDNLILKAGDDFDLSKKNIFDKIIAELYNNDSIVTAGGATLNTNLVATPFVVIVVAVV